MGVREQLLLFLVCLLCLLLSALGSGDKGYEFGWTQTGHDAQRTNRLPPSPYRRPILSNPYVRFERFDDSVFLFNTGVRDVQPLIFDTGIVRHEFFIDC